MLALFSFCRVSSYRLGDLVAIFASLYLSSNRAEDDDLLGDAYEDLMRHFATESGKSKGQFYTPSESPRKLVMSIIIAPHKASLKALNMQLFSVNSISPAMPVLLA